MIIAPEILVTPDRPTVRFREPREKIDLDKELQKVLKAQGWGLGTYFNVQFISHDRTELLSQGEFAVVKDAESLQTNEENQYSPSTRTVYVKEVEQLGEFRVFGKGLSDLEGEDVTAKTVDRVFALESLVVEMRAEIEVLKKPKRRGPKPKAEKVETED